MNKKKFLEIVKPFTMTSEERINELYDSLEHIRLNNINGDLVECGVWKGGNILGIIEYLNFYEMYNKNVWLYDTFKGMTTPEDIDVDLNNQKAIEILNDVLCYSSIDEVKNNISQSRFPKNNIKYIIGDVCETLNFKENIPNKISLLRLDTDWYQSTKKELEILYPILENEGILIVDDYGHWKGSKKAVDEYFEFNSIDLFFKKIDYTGIKIVK
jgi:O-methyltransferase